MSQHLEDYNLESLAAWSQWLGANPLLMAGAAAFIMVLFLLVAGGWGRRRSAAMEFAEIKGRLTAIAEIGAQKESQQMRSVNERIDALSRQLAQTLDTVGARLGDNVAEAGRRTSETLSTLNERLVLIDDARQSLSALSSEVGSLHDVLANKQARGAFGQVRMESIVRDALPAGAYEFQPTLSNGRRPDCVIRLPNSAGMAVDSKFPLEGFEALRAARGTEDRKAAQQAVREAVVRHVDDIAEKYLIAGETQDTALMFVPSESIYAELHEGFPDLVQKAHRARVMIVAPNTLMLAVQTVQALLKDAKMRDHADVIQREVGRLLDDVSRLVERVAELERHFALSNKALEKVSASAGKISGRGQKLTSLDLDKFEGDEAPVAERLTARGRGS